MLPLDGPSVQGSLSITDTTVVEVKVGASRYDERKVVSIQPTDGRIYIYLGDSSLAPPSVVDVQTKGFIVYKNAKETFEAGDKQPIYALAVSGTVDVRFSERA